MGSIVVGEEQRSIRRLHAKTVSGLKWARVAELEMELDGKKIATYCTTAKIYFDVEK